MKFEPLPWSFHRSGMSPALSRIAMLGNYPPRRCGLATYTKDSLDALRAHLTRPLVDLYVMDDGQVDGYPDDLVLLIGENDVDDYLKAADAINASGANMLWIQHEFGIFGGEAGAHLLALVNRVEVPITVTLHTILENPSPAQRSVLQALCDAAATIVVMAQKGRAILSECYRVDHDKVTVVPHGVPDCVWVEPATARRALALSEQPTILTFGLLAPDKGIEDMIAAMPAVRAAVPDARYIVLGATHPNLIKNDIDLYRRKLTDQIDALGLADSVTLIDRFVSLDELTQWLAAADVYVTPYHNPDQITSGTLSYAIGLGKPVVATPYVHACEALANDVGCIVPFRAPAALGAAVADLLCDDVARKAMSARAYALGRSMIWKRNADAMLAAMARGLRRSVTRPATSVAPVLMRDPIERMTDDTGMFQHSVFGVADRRHGYCIDDNARGLLLMSMATDLPLPVRTRLANVYASFVEHAWNADERRFRNFMGFDRTWLEPLGSEDSNGRALWVLGHAAGYAPTGPLRTWAGHLFDRVSSEVGALQSPRARAFAMLGAGYIADLRPGDERARTILEDGGRLLMTLLNRSSRPDWPWFEIVLSYDNTRLPEALIAAGQVLDRPAFTEAGLETLAWIATQTSGRDGQFRPVGTTSFGEPFAPPALFDQQPLEAWAMIDACATAYAATSDPKWLDHATSAHSWFLGNNVLSIPLINPESGECSDGLTPFEANMNNGAESVIAWQAGHRRYLTLLDMQANWEKVRSGALTAV